MSLLLLAQVLTWGSDLDAALAESAKSGRLVVLHFRLPGRPLSRLMDEETFANAEVVKRADSFHWVRLDPSLRAADFERYVGEKGAMATALLDGTGDTVSVLPGHAGPGAFVAWLDRAAAGRPALKAAAGPFERGEAYERLGSPRRAEACFREAKGSAAAHERLARLLVRRGRNLEARSELAEYRRLDPADASKREDRARLTEALALVLERKPAEARRLLESSAKDFPESPEADQRAVALGWVQHELGDDKASIATMEAALARFPDSPFAAELRLRIAHVKNPPPEHEH
jgi:tetratricopeptide (TPR) repeat protein